MKNHASAVPTCMTMRMLIRYSCLIVAILASSFSFSSVEGATISGAASGSAATVGMDTAAVSNNTRTRKITVEPIDYEDTYTSSTDTDTGDNDETETTTTTALMGYVSVPQSVINDPLKQVPAVVILPTWENVNEYVKIRATMIAEEYGWVGFAADIYGKDLHNVQDPTMQIQIEQATQYRSDPHLFNSRIQAAIDKIAEHPNVDPTQISIIGYCLGGTGVLSYSFANTDSAMNDDTIQAVGGVSFHGGLLDFEVDDDDDASSRMFNPVLVLSGGDDDTGTAVEELEAKLVSAQATFQITRYSKIVHGFTVFDRPGYDEWVDHRSWEEMGTFLQEVYSEIEYGSIAPTEGVDYRMTDSDSDTEEKGDDAVAVQTVLYDDNGFALKGYLAMPAAAAAMVKVKADSSSSSSSSSSSNDSTKYPAVVIVPDWDGANEYELERAVLTAQHNKDDAGKQYIAMVADIYGVNYTTVEDFPKRIELSTLYRNDPTLFVSRIQAAIDEVVQHPNVDADHIFVAGYCLGGTGSLDYAFAPTHTTYQGVKAVVPIHGGLSPLRTINTEDGLVSPYILVLSGGVDDAHGNTTELEQQLDSTDAKWEITRYSNAEHGFTKWGSAAYQPRADSRSWWSMMSLFDDLVQIDDDASGDNDDDNSCMVKKKKFGYKKCTKLKKNKCAAETLCVMNKETNKCAHVCDDKEKSDCKKPTLKGKKMCTFQK